MLNYSKYGINHSTLAVKVKTFSLRRTGFVFLGITTSALLFLFAIEWAKKQSLFAFEDIIVEGNHFVSANEIRQLAKIDSKHRLFEIDLKAVAQRVEKHQLIKEAKVSRRLPGSIVIKAFERQPIAIFAGARPIAIDDEGKLLTKLSLKQAGKCPLITDVDYSGKLSDHPEMMSILDFLRFARNHQENLYGQISKIFYSQNHGICFYLAQSKIKVVLGDEDFAQRTSNFFTVWNHLEKQRKLTSVEYFDLRFKQQVIIKANRKS